MNKRNRRTARTVGLWTMLLALFAAPIAAAAPLTPVTDIQINKPIVPLPIIIKPVKPTPIQLSSFKDGAVKWKLVTHKKLSQIAVGPNGTLYVGVEDADPADVGSGIYAVTPQGKIKWTFPLSGASADRLAVAPDGTVYFVDGGGALIAIKPDGTKKWSYETGVASAPPVVGADGSVYVNASGTMSVVSSSGKPKLAYSVPGDATAHAVGKDGTLYVGSGATLIAYNPTGTIKWKAPLKGKIFSLSAPAIAGNAVYITVYTDDKKALTTLQSFDLNGKWKADYLPNDTVSYLAAGPDGTLYATSEYALTAISPDKGIKWTATLAARIYFNPPIVGPNLIVVQEKYGHLLALDGNGKPLWHIGPDANNGTYRIAIGNTGAVYYPLEGVLSEYGPQ